MQRTMEATRPSRARKGRTRVRAVRTTWAQSREATRPAPAHATGPRGRSEWRHHRGSNSVAARRGGVAAPGQAARFGLLVLAFGLIAVPAGLVLAVPLYFDLKGVILPGVQVGGVPVQGLTPNQAAAELDRVWNQELRMTAVDLSDPSRAWLTEPAEFGLRVNPEESAARAYAAGRGQDLLDGFVAIWEGLNSPREIPPKVDFDPLVALEAYDRWAPRLALASTDADLSLEGEALRVSTSSAGRELDLLASLEWLAADPRSAMLDHGLIPLVTRPVEPSLPDVEAQVRQVERLLTSEVTLTAYDPVTGERFNWKPDRGRIAAWIAIQRQPQGITIGLHEERMQEYLALLSEELGTEREFDRALALEGLYAGLQGEPSAPLILRYRPRQHVVRGGETVDSISVAIGIPSWKWIELNPQVKARGLVVGETLTMPPRDAMLELPVVPDKRIEISLSEQRLWAYQDGELFDEQVVSTGISRSPTMPGIFQVKSHYINAYASKWDLYMPHFLGIYDAVPGFENGIHGLPLLSNGVRLWGNVLGRPASYGCIILTLEAAERLYEWAEEGVVVEIRR